MKEIENNWTRGIFRTFFREFENGNHEVAHRCVICKWHITAACTDGEEPEATTALVNRVNRELRDHEMRHPEARWICDWWAFQSAMHYQAARMNPYHGLDALQWRN